MESAEVPEERREAAADAARRSLPTEVARHYDELDRFYRELWGAHVHHGLWGDAASLAGRRRDGGSGSVAAATRRLVDLVADRASLRPGARVCDVGCGYGATAAVLASDYGCEVVGYTVSAAQHERTTAQAAPGCRFVLGDWLENDLADGAFDAAIAIESMGHMADRARAIAEVARVLRPDGRAVLCAWLAADAAPRWSRRALLDPICREGRLAGLGTEADFGRWLAHAGLELERFEDLTRAVRGTWTVVARRAAAAVITRPRYVRYLLRPDSSERGFALSIARIWLAYRVGAMRYGVFTARKR
jgi:tocopherol O-methyltransferase